MLSSQRKLPPSLPTENPIYQTVDKDSKFSSRSISALNSLTFSMSSVLRAKAKFMKKLSQVLEKAKKSKYWNRSFAKSLDFVAVTFVFSKILVHRKPQQVRRSVERRDDVNGRQSPGRPTQDSKLPDLTSPNWENLP